MLSPKKIDLLRYLIGLNSKDADKSMGKIAKSLSRRREAVSRDVRALKKRRLVSLKRAGNRIEVGTDLEEIHIRLFPSRPQMRAKA